MPLCLVLINEVEGLFLRQMGKRGGGVTKIVTSTGTEFGVEVEVEKREAIKEPTAVVLDAEVLLWH